MDFVIMEDIGSTLVFWKSPKQLVSSCQVTCSSFVHVPLAPTYFLLLAYFMLRILREANLATCACACATYAY
jgi:hypothetical protein